MAEFETALSLDNSEDDNHNTVAISDGEEIKARDGGDFSFSEKQFLQVVGFAINSR
ncbi:hypothetical protein KI387_012347, partial [Taxus chinensis]